MDDSFFLYLDRLELMAFFSGYALIYLIIRSLGDAERIKKVTEINISSLLPYAYALVGILYLGLQLKNLYPDYTWANIAANPEPYLKIWGLLSILFFIPVLNKKIVLSLLHSLVFFFFLANANLNNLIPLILRFCPGRKTRLATPSMAAVFWAAPSILRDCTALTRCSECCAPKD